MASQDLADPELFLCAALALGVSVRLEDLDAQELPVNDLILQKK